MSEIVKETKEEAFYTIIPDGRRRCADCVFFEQVPGTLDMAGTCEKVVGIIKRDARCDNYQYANGLWPYQNRRRAGK